MLGMKIDYLNFDLYEKLAEVVDEVAKTDKAGLNNTFVVVEYVDGKPKLMYYDERDFRKYFKFDGVVAHGKLCTVVRITPDEQESND